MAKTESDPLFLLVRTMTRAEKRYFRLHGARSGEGDQPLFVQIFRELEKMETYREEILLKKIPGIKKRQLSNLKAHVYRQVLADLRMLYRFKDPVISLREQLDYARVLYDKGLYDQSLRILSRIKRKATQMEEIILCHEIIEFEKLIESRHITPGRDARAEALSAESRQISRQLSSQSYLSTLSLRMYGLYLQLGHARNEKDAQMLKTFLESQLVPEENPGMSFYERIYLYQTYCWYYYTLQDFILYYRYTRKWVDLFAEFADQKKVDPSLYLKALHNLLTACFYTSNHTRFLSQLAELESFIRLEQEGFDENTRLSAFIYLYTALLNRHFLEGRFDEGLPLAGEITRRIGENIHSIDTNRVMVFYYKVGCLYFGAGHNQEAVGWLNQVIQMKAGDLRQDIQCFARILHLIAHFEMENYSLVEYLIRSVYHFLSVHKDLSLVMQEITRFLRRNLYAHPKEFRQAFSELRDRLIQVSRKPYEKRSFLYLDIISWLESKIEGVPVQTIIHRKFLEGIPRY